MLRLGQLKDRTEERASIRRRANLNKSGKTTKIPNSASAKAQADIDFRRLPPREVSGVDWYDVTQHE